MVQDSEAALVGAAHRKRLPGCLGSGTCEPWRSDRGGNGRVQHARIQRLFRGSGRGVARGRDLRPAGRLSGRCGRLRPGGRRRPVAPLAGQSPFQHANSHARMSASATSGATASRKSRETADAGRRPQSNAFRRSIKVAIVLLGLSPWESLDAAFTQLPSKDLAQKFRGRSPPAISITRGLLCLARCLSQ